MRKKIPGLLPVSIDLYILVGLTPPINLEVYSVAMRSFIAKGSANDQDATTYKCYATRFGKGLNSHLIFPSKNYRYVKLYGLGLRQTGNNVALA